MEGNAQTLSYLGLRACCSQSRQAAILIEFIREKLFKSQLFRRREKRQYLKRFKVNLQTLKNQNGTYSKTWLSVSAKI